MGNSGTMTAAEPGDVAAMAHETHSAAVDFARDTAASQAHEILRLHEFLEGLASVDSRLVSVVEMHYFAGVGHDQIAKSLGVTERSVRRDVEKARLLLLDALQ
jgi:DNA-directed RNA polymerase specialized sigma24 family protein